MTNSFIYDSVYHGAIKLGSTERFAREQAMLASDKYKKHSYIGKPSKLIEDCKKEAVKLSKIKAKRK